MHIGMWLGCARVVHRGGHEGGHSSAHSNAHSGVCRGTSKLNIDLLMWIGVCT